LNFSRKPKIERKFAKSVKNIQTLGPTFEISDRKTTEFGAKLRGLD
jgi:hypothetical protein